MLQCHCFILQRKPFSMTNLNGRSLQQSDLVFPRELQESRKLLGKVHNLLDRHDCKLSEVGEALLTHLSVLQVLTLWPRLLRKNTHTGYCRVNLPVIMNPKQQIWPSARLHIPGILELWNLNDSVHPHTSIADISSPTAARFE